MPNTGFRPHRRIRRLRMAVDLTAWSGSESPERQAAAAAAAAHCVSKA